MADSTDAASLPAAGYDLYAGYVDGKWQSYLPAVARFGYQKVVPIAVFSSTNMGTVGDCETGDMTPQTAVSWVQMRRAAGVDPTIYCSLALWPTVQQAFNDAGVPQPHYWIAAYPGNGPNLYPGSIAHQYADQGPNGENIDVSVVADYWPGVDPPPQPPVVPPTNQENETMTSLIANGQLHVWATINGVVYHWWQNIGQPEWGGPQILPTPPTA